jgi:hypothetical protein
MRFSSSMWLVCLAAWLGSAALARAAPAGQTVDAQVEYTFGGRITFRAVLEPAPPIQQVEVWLEPEGQNEPIAIPANAKPSSGEVEASSDLKELGLRAFSNVGYWFEGSLSNGAKYTSPRFSFYYEDNRFRWQTLESRPFRIHWYAGETGFAQDVLSVAQAGLTRVNDFLTVSPPSRVDVYVYEDAPTMQATLLLSGQEWVAGQADPGLGVVLVSLPPGPDQRLEMERQIPHEIMHIMLYQADPAAYDLLPAWFIEGLASITELYPHPDYQKLLENSYQAGGLIPIKSLCQIFPRDAGGALLAYAEAASFTRFLYRQFGREGLESLVTNFATGPECEPGVEKSFGSSLSRLESEWRRETFAENPWQTASESLLPWVVLLLAILAGPVLAIIGWLRSRPEARVAG